MRLKNHVVAILFCIGAALPGCSERDLAGLAPAPISDDPLVFDDTFGDGVDFQAFLGSSLTAVAIDRDVFFAGAASLRVTVPGPGVEGGTFAGGAFTSSFVRDLSSYDALVFHARSSIPATLNVAGLGNDNTGTSLYEAQRSAIPLTTSWSAVIIPIPDPSRLTLERGLFFFAEGHENNQGYTLWFDEIHFARIGTITDPRPAMATRAINRFVGMSVAAEQTRVTFNVNGEDIEIQHSPRYFDYFSSDETVAVAAGGVMTTVGSGSATVTATLGAVDVQGTTTLNVLPTPSAAAPAPAYPASDVIALFSDAYATVAVDTWRAGWSVSGPVEDLVVAGGNVKVYTNLTYAGIEFTTGLIDASDMTHLRLDVWAPVGTLLRVKLVDFGEDGIWNQPLDQSELTFTDQTVPAFVPEQWCVLDIPLSDFGLQSRAHLAQLIISTTNARNILLDNVLFHR